MKLHLMLFVGKFGKGAKGGKSGAPRNELKSKDQILKARKKKEQLMKRQRMGKVKNQRRKTMKGK